MIKLFLHVYASKSRTKHIGQRSELLRLARPVCDAIALEFRVLTTILSTINAN